MAIGPIPAFSSLTSVEPADTQFELPPVSRVDDAARAGKYSSGRRQSPGRQQSDSADVSTSPSPQGSAPEIEAAPDPENGLGSQINLFA